MSTVIQASADMDLEETAVARRDDREASDQEPVARLVGQARAEGLELVGENGLLGRLTELVLEGMAEWQNRPLDAVYPVIFIDAIHVKVRDGQVADRPIYVALAVTVDGERDILGLWAGDGGEGATFWLHVLIEIKNRRVGDALMVVCDGLKGLPQAIEQVWPQAVMHLLRAFFRYAARRHWDAIAKAPRPIYTAPTEAAALERFYEFAEAWGGRCPAIVKLWTDVWAEFVPFLNFDAEIRRVICSTNAIESVNARIRRAVKARGHFPNEQTALKYIYMVIMSLDLTGKGRKRWVTRWKAALNAFAITFDGRLSVGQE
ncbi:IS256 family transposase [Streptosporangium sp. G11]|uniref:IS256 family transposase n=1 Tax=Streptosporangium sp. G11 TaxID=3436926 RepID=UPI003EBAEE35